ncbi:MAG: DNA polymerase III subunit chi [Pseudomonadota bacterium]
MKQVDFYIIANQVVDAKFKLASRLSNKLVRMQQKALLVTDNSAASKQLDQIMWSFSDTSFVAHDCLASTPSPQSSIHIRELDDTADQALANDYDVLVNLSSEIPVYSHHFSRIAEIVDADEQAKTQARERFKSYKEEGFELKTHTIEL